MFKKLLLTSALLVSNTAFGQEFPTFHSVQPCADYKTLKQQTDKYDETILFKGNSILKHISGQLVNAEFVFTVNQDTGTWTMVALYPNRVACMVTNGTRFTPFQSNTKKNSH